MCAIIVPAPTPVIVNLTPHPIVVVGVTTVPPSGTVARVSSTSSPRGEVCGIAIVSTTFGEVVGLPPAQEGTYFIVSALVRAALPTRSDLLSPGELVRDEGGQVIGCKNLIAN